MSFRPSYHFTPPSNWMNDPNGMVYANREYHLFYQYHPDSDVWGPMHWGHAISRDLVNWEHLPVALYPDEHGMIFSGSAVVDKHNTAGFGKDAIIAIFTHDKNYVQCQSLAYSRDSGRTWTKYSGNPVLFTPDGTVDFRDPKVFWYGEPETGHWVMCLAVRDRILFYTSPDLIQWTQTGSFGPGYGSAAGVWETPELFALSVTGTHQTRWVLTVGVQDGAPAGGSGTQYFVGIFDGTRFICEDPPETVLWADYGADFYAAQSWNDEPDGRRLLIGWMNNWQYALLIPSVGQRGIFSLIREVLLTRTEAGIRLVSKPSSEVQKLRSKPVHWQDTTIQPGENLLQDICGNALEIVGEFRINDHVDCFGFRVLVGEQERTTISYHIKGQRLLIDRSASGAVDFKESFANAHSANLPPIGDMIRLHIFLDRCSVEVFANDGRVTFTELVFPSQDSLGLELFVEGGDLTVLSLDVFELEAIRFEGVED